MDISYISDIDLAITARLGLPKRVSSTKFEELTSVNFPSVKRSVEATHSSSRSKLTVVVIQLDHQIHNHQIVSGLSRQVLIVVGICGHSMPE